MYTVAAMAIQVAREAMLEERYESMDHYPYGSSHYDFDDETDYDYDDADRF